MIKKNKECVVCGTKYSYCPNCREYYNEPTWKNMFDTENCKKIYAALAEKFAYNNIESAKAILTECDLSKFDSFKENVKENLSDLLEKAPEEPKTLELESEDSIVKVENDDFSYKKKKRSNANKNRNNI